MNDSPQKFFDEISDDYTEAIYRCVPRYQEMLGAILHYLPTDWTPARILELGCGSGNLSERLCRTFPNAAVRLVDFSEGLLGQCRTRLAEFDRVEFQRADFRNLDFAPGSFDLVTSSIAIHHLTHTEKAQLFAKIHNWLDAGGIFTYSDQFAGATDDLYVRQIADWKQQSEQLGATPEEWAAWMEHQRAHDHHAPLVDQIKWLQAAGFHAVDCTWRYVLWTVVQARK